PAAGAAPDDALALAAAAEQGSEHPLGEAIVAAAKSRGLGVPAAREFRAVPGQGVEALVPEGRILLGNARMMTERGIDVTALAARGRALAEAGKTGVYVALGAELVGLLAVADMPKPEARSAVEGLRALGIEVAMLTGDGRSTAEAIARQVGIA